MSAELLEENRELKQTLEQRERALFERDEKIVELERQVARIAELEREIAALEKELRGAARDRAKLEARLKELLAKRRALAELVTPGQLALFADEALLATPPCANEAPDGETGADRIRPRHQRKNAPREISYEALPREHVQHEISESERICPVTGKTLVVIGEKTSEQLEYRQAKLVVVVHHRHIYGLAESDREERKSEPIVAPMPARPIENGLAGAALLAWILVQKYCNHLPLYRQSIFAREGLELPRQTLCDWVLAAAYNLGPIQEAMKKEILASGVLQLDDTPVECQAGKGAPNFKAHLWTYASPLVSGVVFDFAIDWGSEHVADFLGNQIEGYLVGDGYPGYGVIVRKYPALIETGCWAHVLRKFRDALKESPVEALRMMRWIGKLFDIEREAIERKLEPEAVHALRAEKSQAVLVEIEKEAQVLRRQATSDQGPLAKALTYLKNQWPTLVRFLEDGRVPIHNNACENALRPLVIGRKNWLFAGSERGGHAAATIYSLIESCRRGDVDPFLYLRDVLVRVCTHPSSRVHELVPANWKELFGATATR